MILIFFEMNALGEHFTFDFNLHLHFEGKFVAYIGERPIQEGKPYVSNQSHRLSYLFFASVALQSKRVNC